MSRMAPIIKREFTQAVGSKAFLIGTILGPLLIIGVFALQFLILAKSGGGIHRIAIIDGTGEHMGEEVEAAVAERTAAPSFVNRATYDFEVLTAAPAARDAITAHFRRRIVARELDAF